MADEQIVTNIVAKADFSDLIADLSRVQSALVRLQQTEAMTNQSLSRQIDVINQQFRNTLRSTGQFSTQFVSVGSDVDKFGRNLDAGRIKLRDFYGTWQKHHRTAGGLVRDLARQQIQLQNSILQPLGKNSQGMMQFAVHIPKGLDLIKNRTKLANMELMIMNRLVQEGAQGLINWGKNTQWAGRQLTVGLTLPIVAFGRAAQTAFREADAQLTRLAKVYGDIGGATAEQLATIRKDVAATAKELSSSYGAAYQETLALSADIAATGKQGKDLLGSIKETTRLAILGEVDRQEAMKATLAIQTAFKSNTEELADSINFLNAVENQTSTTLNDLVEAIPKAGPVIKGLGGDVKDLALYITAMREGGISASEGANALKSGLASLINPTKVAVARFQEFGIDLLGMVQKNAGNTTALLLDMQAALDNLNPLQKQQAIEQLFGKFQFARLNALFNNLGRQGSQTLQVLDLMKASAADLEAVAARELTMVTESASGKYRRQLETLRANLAGIGDEFLKVSTKVLGAVNKILDFVANLPDPIKKILTFFGGLTAIAGPLIMLTGVLGNFFGYIIKGVYHFKALFKGAQGWKLLTPEILAANAAGEAAEGVFYSDAQAATILRKSIDDLVASYQRLITAEKSATGATFSTAAGTPLVINAASQSQGPRQVNPSHPLLTPYRLDPEGNKVYPRSSSHMVPKGVEQPGTIFGLVPTDPKINLLTRDNPQIYMDQPLPSVKGLTSVNTKYGPISTGIIAQEAARYHAMTAAMAMQSTQELQDLKKSIATTRTATASYMNVFDDILPITTQFTNSAAAQSAAIVADLQAGTITVAQARQKIIDLNILIERQIAEAMTAYAAGTGRTFNPYLVPGTNQPIVDDKGNSNMREWFKKQPNRNFINLLAGASRVRTGGAGYNIETTIPKRFNMGGDIESFGPNKTRVSGPASINYDDRLGSIPLGGYVLNQEASLDPQNADLVAMAPYTFENGGEITAALTPAETIFGPKIQKMPELYGAVVAANNGYNLGGQILSPGGDILENRKNYGIRLFRSASRGRQGIFQGSYGRNFWKTQGANSANILDSYIRSLPSKDRYMAAKVIQEAAEKINRKTGRTSKTIEFSHLDKNGIIDKALKKAGLPTLNLEQAIHATHLTRANVVNGKRYVSRYTVDYDARSNLQANMGKLKVSEFIKRNMSRSGKYDNLFKAAGVDPKLWAQTEKAIDKKIKSYLRGKGNNLIGDDYGDILFEQLIPIIDGSIVESGGLQRNLDQLKKTTVLRSRKGYALGGDITSGKINYGLAPSAIRGYLHTVNKKRGVFDQSVVPKSFILNRLGARYKYNPEDKGYSIISLPANPNLRIFDGLGLSPAGKRALYGNLVDKVLKYRPGGMDASKKRGFSIEGDSADLWEKTLFTTKLGGNLSPQDKEIINSLYDRASKSVDSTMPRALQEQMFDSKSEFSELQSLYRNPKNQYRFGGKIRGYNRGGRIGKYNYGGPIKRSKLNYGQLPGGYTSTDLKYLLSRLGIGDTFRQAGAGSAGPLIKVERTPYVGGSGVRGNAYLPQMQPSFTPLTSTLKVAGMFSGLNSAIDSVKDTFSKAGSAIKKSAGSLSESFSKLRTSVPVIPQGSAIPAQSLHTFGQGVKSPYSTTPYPGPASGFQSFMEKHRAQQGIATPSNLPYRYNAGPGMLPAMFMPMGGKYEGFGAYAGEVKGLKEVDGKMITSQKSAGRLGFRKNEYFYDGKQITAAQARAMGVETNRFARGGGMGTMMAGQMAGMGLMSQGHSGAGMAVMAGSMFAPQMASGISKVASGLKDAVKNGGGLFSILSKMAFAGPIAAITAGVVAIGTAWKLWRNSVERTRKEEDLMFGTTKKNAEQLGIKYKNINAELQAARAAADLFTQSGLKAFDANSKFGGGFLTTAKEMKKEIAAMKNNAKDVIKTINELDKTWMNDGSGKDDFSNAFAKSTEQLLVMAKNIKTQYINSGLSVDEATKKVYALIAASERSGQAFKIISDEGFRGITDSVTGAEQAVKSYAKQVKVGFAGGEQSGNALANTLQFLQAGSTEIENQIRKEEEKSQKLKQNKDYVFETKASYEGYSQIIDKIGGSTDKSALFTKKQLEDIKETNAELYLMLNEADTATSAFAKMRIELAGISVDLKNMSPQAAEALAKYEAQLSDVIKNLDIFAKSNKLIAQLKNAYDKNTIGVQKFAEAEKKTYEETIKRIDAKIKRINDEANARKKAIELEFEQEDAALALQKAELEYQHAVASGNVDAANAAQNTIKSMQNEIEKQAALRAIEEDRAAKEAKAQKQKEDAAEKNAAAQEKVAAAQLKSLAIQEKLMKVEGYQAQFQNIIKKQSINAALLEGAVLSGNNADIEKFSKEETAIAGSLQDLSSKLAKEINTTKDKDFSKQLADVFGSTGLIEMNKGKAVAQSITKQTLVGTPTSSGAAPVQTVIDKSSPLWNTLQSLSTQSSTLADDIKGGATLADIVTAIEEWDPLNKRDKFKFKDPETGQEVIAPKNTGKKGGPSTAATTTNEKGEKVLLKEGILETKMSKFNGGVKSASKLKPGDIVIVGTGKEAGITGVESEDPTKPKTSGAIEIVEVDPVKQTVRYKIKYKDGGHIKSYYGGTTDGPIVGPGTGTSDSIIARLSNGEYVTRASSVSDIGVQNMTLINQKGVQGLFQAAQNLAQSNSAFGGYMKKFPMGGLIPYYHDGGEVSSLLASRNNYSGMPPANSSSTLIDKSINVNGPLNFNFAEAPRNGRELLAQFKAAIQEDNIKKGGTIIA